MYTLQQYELLRGEFFNFFFQVPFIILLSAVLYTFSQKQYICWENGRKLFYHFCLRALIFLVSLRIWLSGGSHSSMQLHVLSAASVTTVCCSCHYCLLQLSLLSAAPIATVCCSCRYCLVYLPLLSAVAESFGCFSCLYCRLQLHHYWLLQMRLYLPLPVASRDTAFFSCISCSLKQLLQYYVAASVASVCCSWCSRCTSL